MDEPTLEESILDSVKLYLGITKETVAFDVTLINLINGVFDVMHQLGTTPEPYHIESSNDKWSDVAFKVELSNMIKTQMFLRVEMLFDPPISTHLTEANKEMIAELDWRTMVEAEYTENVEE